MAPSDHPPYSVVTTPQRFDALCNSVHRVLDRAPALAAGADTMVRGRTHVAFLEAVMRELSRTDVSVIEPSDAVAQRLNRRLEERTSLPRQVRLPVERFFISAVRPAATPAVIAKRLGRPADVVSAYALGFEPE